MASELQTIVFHRIDGYQKNQHGSSTNVVGTKRGKKGSIHAHPEAVVRVLREELNTFVLSQRLSRVSIASDGNHDNDCTTNDDDDDDVGVVAAVDGIGSNDTDQESSIMTEVSDALVQSIYNTVAVTEPSDPAMNESVDRVLEIVAAIGCSLSPLTGKHLVDTCRELSVVSLDSVRAVSCRVLGLCANVLLTNVGERGESCAPAETKVHENQDNSEQKQDTEEDGEENDWEHNCLVDITACLIPRLLDKAQSVRLEAIQAVGILAKTNADAQDALAWNMAHDPSVANRAAAVSVFPVCPSNVDHFLARIRDVKDKVRVAAIEAVSTIHLEDLSSRQCRMIVQSSLTDR